MVTDPFGEEEREIRSEDEGIIIGRSNLPVINEGDALFHVARVKRIEDASERIDQIAAHLEADPMFDEDEII